ncbi:MAG: sodium:alanine symporter family protein, partial [Clostridia bacterium]|nr:sodium:alanine symporter family protein [Clostridia bacterium]
METLNKINSFVWGTPTLLLIFFTGVILTVRTNFFTVKNFGLAAKQFFKGDKTQSENRLTPLQSASAALSATMGTGNIVGVAGAIALGGPGAVFWMWISSLFCMTIKFAEIALAVRYRETNRDGSYSGGAMYYIKNALPRFFTPLATVFCICGVAAAFGVGNMTQINTMSASVSQ